MIESSDLRMTKIPLNHRAGHMPALGFGTLIPEAAVTLRPETHWKPDFDTSIARNDTGMNAR